MLPSIRSALLICAAISASSVAPAQAGPTSEPLIPATSATLPTVAVPALLDPPSEPVLTAPEAPEVDSTGPEAVEPLAAKPTGDLTDMVAQLRGSNPGSRELECLATGIYFESKSEPLAGQLAVGKVIANRSKS